MVYYVTSTLQQSKKMKRTFYIFSIFFLILAGCGKQSDWKVEEESNELNEKPVLSLPANLLVRTILTAELQKVIYNSRETTKSEGTNSINNEDRTSSKSQIEPEI